MFYVVMQKHTSSVRLLELFEIGNKFWTHVMTPTVLFIMVVVVVWVYTIICSWKDHRYKSVQ